ncbi:VWA domain-containing protein [Rhizobium laguerreae]|nr:VWA domain-containing protein [Rhizobium laguerreae]
MTTDLNQERLRRWKLALGDGDTSGLSSSDQRMAAALSALYDTDDTPKKGQRGGLGKSSPKVAKWLGDIREFFPSPVVQVIQKDAFDRLGLQALIMEPEFLETLEADVHLVAQLMNLRGQMPPRTVETARAVIAKVVEELMKRLRGRTEETLVGALNRSKRTRRPRFSDIDWHRTINANLRHWQPEYNTIVPETLIGYSRKTRTRADLDHVMLCVDQSGSMAPSVVFASIFAAVMASLPVLSTQLVCFDTAVVDWTEQLADPVSVLFGIQLGGGTDIAGALKYCHGKIEYPSKTHMVLISDLYENGNSTEMLKHAAAIKQAGINLIVLLALSDEGRPAYDAKHASVLASMGCPVFACTPDLFPDMMAAALAKQDIAAWASANDVEVIRAA